MTVFSYVQRFKKVDWERSATEMVRQYICVTELACSVKMAGYWSSSFTVCSWWTETGRASLVKRGFQNGLIMCLCVKTVFGKDHSYENIFLSQVNFHTCQIYFHIYGFARNRDKKLTTQRWPIENEPSLIFSASPIVRYVTYYKNHITDITDILSFARVMILIISMPV